MRYDANKRNKEIKEKEEKYGGEKWHEGKGEEVYSFDNSVNGDPKEKKKKAKEKNGERKRKEKKTRK